VSSKGTQSGRSGIEAARSVVSPAARCLAFTLPPARGIPPPCPRPLPPLPISAASRSACRGLISALYHAALIRRQPDMGGPTGPLADLGDPEEDPDAYESGSVAIDGRLGYALLHAARKPDVRKALRLLKESNDFTIWIQDADDKESAYQFFLPF
jgi:hypothetical protein